MLQVIESGNPDAFTLTQHQGAGYIVARYAPARLSRTDSLFAAYAADAGAQLEIWIEVLSKRVVKGMMSTSHGSQEVSRVIQAFACFGEAIDVQPPPWLNAVRDPSGGYRGVNDSVPILRHYR